MAARGRRGALRTPEPGEPERVSSAGGSHREAGPGWGGAPRGPTTPSAGRNGPDRPRRIPRAAPGLAGRPRALRGGRGGSAAAAGSGAVRWQRPRGPGGAVRRPPVPGTTQGPLPWGRSGGRWPRGRERAVGLGPLAAGP
uniref:Uncharacterized protein n=1 Tax=Calidris pygmaea TaxID=425635 RepID=A0A8C3JUD4_9CHAR